MIRPGIRRLFRLPFGRRQAARDGVDEELRLHLELRTEQLVRAGLSPAAARAEAERRFGPLAQSRRELERAARHREGRVQPVLGRTFRPEEMEPGHEWVALLSHGFWLDRFGGDPGVLGRAITLNGLEHEVVGVAPPGFDPPASGVLWIPIANKGSFANARRAM